MTDKAVEVGQIQKVSVAQLKLATHLTCELIGVGIGIGIAVEIGIRKRFAIPKAIPTPNPMPTAISGRFERLDKQDFRPCPRIITNALRSRKI